MLEGLDQINWDELPQPEWNRSGAVPAALRSLATVATPEAALHIYHRVLYVFGNNHAGTYYPVVVAAMPFLGELLTDGSAVVRETTLDILLDLVGSFKPQPGFQVVTEVSGASRRLSEALRQAVAGIVPAIRASSSPGVTTERERALASEVLSYFADLGSPS